MSINHPAGIDEGLYIEQILTQVRNEYLPNDIFDQLSANFINSTADEPTQIPDAIYLKIQADATKSRTIKIAMRKEYSGAPNLGSNADPRLTEEDTELKFCTFHYTDLSKTIASQNYGIGAIEKKPFNVFEYKVDGMGIWYKQYFGKMRRQSLLQLQSENLEDAPHFLAAGWNANWCVPNRSDSQQPAYDDDPQDHTDRIVGALVAAGTGISACCSIGYLMQLERWARDKCIAPITLPNGKSGYVVVLPTPQCVWLKKLIQDGNVGYMFTNMAAFGQDVLQKYPNALYIFQGLLIVEDDRYPTLTIGGSASNDSYTSDGGEDYTMHAHYRGCGRADDGSSDPRDKTANSRQVGFLIGQGAIGEVMPEDFHWEYEYEMYDKYYGAGIFCSVGIKNIRFDVTNGNSTTMQQDNSAILPFAIPPSGYYYTQAT